MSNNTIIQQGSFTSTGASVNINLRSGVDWMRVYNYSIAGADQTTAVGYEFYWQLGMGTAGLVYLKSNAANAANLVDTLPNGSFEYIDTSVNVYGVKQSTITAISTAVIPVVTNTGTNGISAGSVVKLLNVAGAPQFGGIDFTVGLSTLTATTFSLDYAPKLSVAGTTGSFMLINFDPLYYPRRRTISSIVSSDDVTLVSTTVAHGYQVGQLIRFNVPASSGMVQINNLQGTIIEVDSPGSFTVNINSSAFTSFVFPLAAGVPFTPAQVVPFGEDTAEALDQNDNILSDATVNTGMIAMHLEGGASLPAGANGNLMFWVAGKSFSNNGR